MEALLAILGMMLFLFLLVLVVIGVLVGMAGWRIDRRNRVDVNQSSPAPVSWLVAPTEAASLHRRLRDAATATRRIGPLDQTATAGSIDDLRRKILQQAALLDHHVAAAGRAPRRFRREMMKTIRPQVLELENLTRRVTDLSQRARGANLPPGVEPPEVALNQIAERVALLETAEAEVSQLERANGLLDAEQLLKEGRSSPPPPLPPSDSAPLPQMPPRPAAQPAPQRRARA